MDIPALPDGIAPAVSDCPIEYCLIVYGDDSGRVLGPFSEQEAMDTRAHIWDTRPNGEWSIQMIEYSGDLLEWEAEVDDK